MRHEQGLDCSCLCALQEKNLGLEVTHGQVDWPRSENFEDEFRRRSLRTNSEDGFTQVILGDEVCARTTNCDEEL